MKKQKHEEKPVRNFFYAVFCIISALAFVFLWFSILFPEIVYQKEILIVSAAILAVSVIFGIIVPLLKLKK